MKKITSYHWVFLKPIRNSGSHLNKKYEHNGIAYSSDIFMAVSLSTLQSCRNGCAFHKRATKRWQHLFENYLYLFHANIFFFKFFSPIVEPYYNWHVYIRKLPFFANKMNAVTGLSVKKCLLPLKNETCPL